MGFMDKANKLAEQAQSKIDEKLQQVNERLSGDSAEPGPPVEYDQHGRPVSAEPAPPPPTPPAAEELERTDEYAPPKVTRGDPLAG